MTVADRVFVGLAEGVEFESVETAVAPDGGKDLLWFEPGGMWSSGKIRLTDGERKYEVRVDRALGRVEVVNVESDAGGRPAIEEADLLAAPVGGAEVAGSPSSRCSWR